MSSPRSSFPMSALSPVTKSPSLQKCLNMIFSRIFLTPHPTHIHCPPHTPFYYTIALQPKGPKKGKRLPRTWRTGRRYEESTLSRPDRCQTSGHVVLAAHLPVLPCPGSSGHNHQPGLGPQWVGTTGLSPRGCRKQTLAFAQDPQG